MFLLEAVVAGTDPDHPICCARPEASDIGINNFMILIYMISQMKVRTKWREEDEVEFSDSEGLDDDN